MFGSHYSLSGLSMVLEFIFLCHPGLRLSKCSLLHKPGSIPMILSVHLSAILLLYVVEARPQATALASSTSTVVCYNAERHTAAAHQQREGHFGRPCGHPRWDPHDPAGSERFSLLMANFQLHGSPSGRHADPPLAIFDCISGQGTYVSTNATWCHVYFGILSCVNLSFSPQPMEDLVIKCRQ